MEIIPAIMPKGFSDIGEHVEKILSFVSYVQIDIMDGEFVEDKTWPFFDKDKQSARELMEGEIRLPFADKIKYEFDLMVRNPEMDLKKYIKLGANRLIVHANSVEDMDLFMKDIQTLGVEWGIAFLTTDNLENFKEVILKADFVQLMGIENIGYQGQSFDPRVLDQVRHLREIKSDVIISIDGGVNLDTASELGNIGVDRLVSGSTVFGANAPEVAIEDLKRI
jgi:ribulose-phosphate 3-epimerase